MSKITKSARGQECQVRIPGICNHDDTTTVFAHLGGGGMGGKVSDAHGAYCCSACHDAVDGRAKTGLLPIVLREYHREGVLRTQLILIDKGLIKIT